MVFLMNVNKSEPADLITFTEKILNEKFHFLCGGQYYLAKRVSYKLG